MVLSTIIQIVSTATAAFPPAQIVTGISNVIVETVQVEDFSLARSMNAE
jgi:hypothetical protein